MVELKACRICCRLMQSDASSENSVPPGAPAFSLRIIAPTLPGYHPSSDPTTQPLRQLSIAQNSPVDRTTENFSLKHENIFCKLHNTNTCYCHRAAPKRHCHFSLASGWREFFVVMFWWCAIALARARSSRQHVTRAAATTARRGLPGARSAAAAITCALPRNHFLQFPLIFLQDFPNTSSRLWDQPSS